MKKIITTLCICLLLTSSLSFAETDFTITAETSDGEILKEIGLISGNGTDLGEEEQIKREELIVMLVKMTSDLKVPFTLPEQATFKDVPKDHWAFEWVERAAAAGITSGLGDGNFGLGQYVSEQQAAAFLMNALERDFTWDTVVEEAKEKGLDSNKTENQFLRKHVFTMSRQALGLTKGSDKLIHHSGNFDQSMVQLLDDYQSHLDQVAFEERYYGGKGKNGDQLLIRTNIELTDNMKTIERESFWLDYLESSIDVFLATFKDEMYYEKDGVKNTINFTDTGDIKINETILTEFKYYKSDNWFIIKQDNYQSDIENPTILILHLNDDGSLNKGLIYGFCNSDLNKEELVIGPAKQVNDTFKSVEMDLTDLLGLEEEALLKELEEKYGTAPEFNAEYDNRKFYSYKDENIKIGYGIIDGTLKNIYISGFDSAGTYPDEYILEHTDLSKRFETALGVNFSMSSEEVSETLDSLSIDKADPRYPDTVQVDYELENNLTIMVMYYKDQIIWFRVFNTDM